MAADLAADVRKHLLNTCSLVHHMDLRVPIVAGERLDSQLSKDRSRRCFRQDSRNGEPVDRRDPDRYFAFSSGEGQHGGVVPMNKGWCKPDMTLFSTHLLYQRTAAVYF